MGKYVVGDEFEVRKATNEDYGWTIDQYNTENVKPILGSLSEYTMLFPEGIDGKPIYYFRHMQPTLTRWSGFTNLGDGPLEPQKGGHFLDLAQRDVKVIPYCEDPDNPNKHIIKAEDDSFEVSFEDRKTHWREGKNGEILDLYGEPFIDPAMFANAKSAFSTNWFMQPTIFQGTYEGKTVIGLGQYDRSFWDVDVLKQTAKELAASGATTYVLQIFHGIREDGRRETFCCQMKPFLNGWGTGFYYLEGEEPIVTNQFDFEAEWHHLPYLPGDERVVYINSVMRFADKEIHFNGHWGSIGFFDRPRFDRLGQTHIFGTWYEGKTPYKHKLYGTFCENMDAYDYNIRKARWTIVD